MFSHLVVAIARKLIAASHATRRVARGIVLAALLVAASSKSSASQAAKLASHDDVRGFHCLDTAATVTRALLDSAHAIFSEQQTVVAQPDGRILVAGNPVYVWRDRGDHWDLLARDSLFGMIIDRTHFVRAIPSPLPGRVLDGMRAVALPDGWWMVTFGEVDSAEPPKQPTVFAMWVGETDGRRWRKLHKLPIVADSLDIGLSSALVWRDGRARLVVPSEKDHTRRAAVYSLDAGRWRVDVNEFASSTSYVAIGLTASRDVLAVVRPVVDAIPDMNSLFLYSKAPRDTAWTQRQLVMRAGEEPVRDPSFVGEGLDHLTWRKSRDGEQGYDIWFATYDPGRDSVSTPTLLTGKAIHFVAMSERGHTLWAVTDRSWPGPSLQLLEWDGTNLGHLTRATRYRGLLGVAHQPGRVVLIAAESAPTPRDPDVVSLIETHTWRCLQQSRSP